MSKDKNKDLEKKKEYTKPSIVSDELVSFGALCNGSNNGGRKASTVGVDPCNSRKLNS